MVVIRATGLQRSVANDRQHHVAQLVGHGVAVTVVQRCAHLGSGVGAGRQLQMPAGIGATGAAAQRDAVGRQVMVRGVEVDGIEVLRRRPLHPATAERPSNDGDTVESTTSNLRSTSVCRDVFGLLAAISTFIASALDSPACHMRVNRPSVLADKVQDVTEYQTITLEQSGRSRESP